MEANKILLEAIALRKCVSATYNRLTVTLAPYILYTRHGEVYVDAITVVREGQPPKEVKLGSYKLTGLRDIALSEREFMLRPDLFDPSDVRYDGTTLFAVE